MNIGIGETTSQGTDKVYVSSRGKEFFIDRHFNGLYSIRMTGGVRPKICDSKYTSYGSAEKELIKYIKSKDKLGFAKYPNKED